MGPPSHTQTGNGAQSSHNASLSWPSDCISISPMSWIFLQSQKSNALPVIDSMTTKLLEQKLPLFVCKGSGVSLVLHETGREYAHFPGKEAEVAIRVVDSLEKRPEKGLRRGMVAVAQAAETIEAGPLLAIRGMRRPGNRISGQVKDTSNLISTVPKAAHECRRAGSRMVT